MFKFWDEISSKLRRRQNVNVLFVIEKHMTDMNQNTKTNQYTRYVPQAEQHSSLAGGSKPKIWYQPQFEQLPVGVWAKY